MTETFYELLGVPEDASTADIEDAYRAAIKRVHPDVSDDVDASERTKRLNKAKAVLTDERERRRYDDVGHDAYVSGGSSGTAASGSGEPDPDDGTTGNDGGETGEDGNHGRSDGRETGSASSNRGRTYRRGGTSRSEADGTGNRRTGVGDRQAGSGDRRTGSRGPQTGPGDRQTGHRTGPGSVGSTADAASADKSASGTWAGRRRWRHEPRGSDRGDHASQPGSDGDGDGDPRSRGGSNRARSDGTDGTAAGRRRSAGSGAQSRDRTGPSRASPGPAWQSNRPGGGTSFAADPANGSSSRGGSRTRDADGSTVDWSWNGWDRNRSWPVRQGSGVPSGLHPERLVPDEQSVLLSLTTFLLYPFFVVSALFPAFPLVARVAVGACTLLLFAYLLSVPRIAIVVFGLWSLLLPAAIWIVPGIGVFSLAGVVGLSVTWIPFALSILTLSVIDG